MFGIDQSPIKYDVKDAAAAFDQLRLNTLCFSNCVRQTGGLRGVVSLYAVSDTDFHPESPVERNVNYQNLANIAQPGLDCPFALPNLYAEQENSVLIR